MNKRMVVLLGVLTLWVSGQETFPVNDVQDNRTGAYAFTNATVYVDFQTKLENATLLIRSKKVEKVGTGLSVPEGYAVFDLKGKTVYPSLIDIYTNYGLPDPPERARGGFFSRSEQIRSDTEGAYNANEAIKAHYAASSNFKVNDKDADVLRKLGFGTVLTFMPDGIARGSSALVTLADDTENNVMLAREAAAHYSFDTGSSSQYYPRSPMGYMALLRQTYLDADWYGNHPNRPFTDQTLDAWIRLQNLPQIFDTGDWLSLLRADKVGDEFGKQYIIKGSGDEYKRVAEVKATNAPLIVPIAFPEAPDVEDPIDADRVDLAEMLHWELAPTNPGVLVAKGIDFALTTHGLKDKKELWSALRKAVEHGLSEEAALRALTQTPARFIGASDRLGHLKVGAHANFLITSGSLFDEKASIYENWIQGKRYVYKDMHAPDLAGKYELKVGEDLTFNLVVAGDPGSHKVSIPMAADEGQSAGEGEESAANDEGSGGEEGATEGEASEETPSEGKGPDKKKEISVNAKFEGEMVSLSFSPKKDEGAIRLSGWLSGKDWVGRGQLADGAWVAWKATYAGEAEAEEEKKKDEKDEPLELGKVIYPFVAYGMETLPQAETVLIKNATVWTCEADGVLTETDVLVKDGKIAKIGKNLSAAGAREVDGTGKHVSPGIIDEHSHIALSGVNDVATNSGMVRMSDVVDPENVHIYRQLAGGVTAAQLLHGSANPIGGQSALVKLRWGSSPQDMQIEGADGFIKFALGENVKRSRSDNSIRYPQTRMGVEQVYMDAFTAARDYEKKWQAYNALSKRDQANAVKPRRDLAMDTMVEILNGKRFVTCHSYVQSEINMLMKVAEHFGFRVNTFTHILEGYKVADKMAAHGAGGSSFADWWAYKWEVRYAIPYNPTLMHNEGVVVAINSDDSEMARRLNQEAAKSVKYGGMSEEDALNMVTINPAKLLHLDKRMGSVKEGKDADLVLWTDHPLSIYARAEMTLVDGRVLYTMAQDLENREKLRLERARLIQKLRKAKKDGAKTGPPRGRGPREWHCEDVLDFPHEGGQ